MTQTNPDKTYHEIEKFLRLCLKCNPTVMELLWLKDYNIINEYGLNLILKREAFLSYPMVKNSYGGYAYAQFKKLQKSNSIRKDKHARHCLRLLRQGKELLSTGIITIQVPNPEEYHALSSLSIEESNQLFEQEYADFQSIKSILPESPNILAIQKYLYDIRHFGLRI